VSGATRADAIVIGAGIVGLSVAFELLRRELTVIVVDRARAGSGASWTAAGMLAPVSEAESDTPVSTALALDSLLRYPEFIGAVERAAETTGLASELRREGTLWVALHADHAADLAHLARTLEGRGLFIERLDAAALRRREPGLSPRAIEGLLLPQDAQVDPRTLIRALLCAIERLGGRLIEQATIDEVLSAEGRVVGVRGRNAEGTELTLDAPRVIVAAGAWSEAELTLPAPRLGVRPVKGQLLRLRGRGSCGLGQVVRTPDVYLVPRSGGDLLIGATMEEQGFDTTPRGGAVLDLLRRAFEVFPGVYELEFVEVSVGLRSAVDDQLPVIGPSGAEGLFLAFGHCRNGVLLAPATAHYLAETIVTGRLARELEPFAPGRTAHAR
jgi:glycine oxidase